jgi:fructose-1,6-bisphosphatase/inositol monophosphatase family enzyme
MYLNEELQRAVEAKIIAVCDQYITPRFYKIRKVRTTDDPEKLQQLLDELRIEGKGQRVVDNTLCVDLTSAADKEAENALVPYLENLIPCEKAIVIGEESIGNVSENLIRLREQQNAKRWAGTVDSVDGTQNFLNGNPDFGCMVSVSYNGVTQHAWIYYPATGLMVSATRGKGAFIGHRNGVKRRIRTRKAPLSRLKFGFYAQDSRYKADLKTKKILQNAALRYASGFYNLKSIAAATLDVIHGRVVVLHPRMKTWDRTGPGLIVAEAGGIAAPMGKRGTDLFNYEGDAPLMFAPCEANANELEAILQPHAGRFHIHARSRSLPSRQLIFG